MGKVRESGMPEEEYWQTFFNPECILKQLDCRDVVDVVEFGCGYGTFTIPAARVASGSATAVDIDPAMVAATLEKCRAAGVSNVTAVVSDFLVEGCPAASAQADYAMLFNILHLEGPVDLLREAYRVLAPGGVAGIIHWRSDISTPRGPSLSIRPRADQCREWGEEAGFDFVRYEPLPCCRWHWGLVMRRPPRVGLT